MRNVFVQWAVGAAIASVLTGNPVRAEETGPPRPPHLDKDGTSPLPGIPKPAGSGSGGSLPLPSGPPTRLEVLVRNLKDLRIDPGPAQRMAQALERAPRMSAKQFSELVSITNQLFDNRITPDQATELKRLFEEESREAKDLTGVSFASALRVANVEAVKPPPAAAGTPVPGDPANKNPFAGGSFSGTRSSSFGGSPGSLEQLVEQATKRQSAQLEQLIKAQLDQTKKALEAFGAGKGPDGQQAGAQQSLQKGLLDGLLADLRKGAKGDEGGGKAGGRDRGEDDEPRSKRKPDDHVEDRGRDRDRDGALSKLRERDRERERDRDRNRGASKGGGGESKESGSGDKKEENNKKDNSSNFSGSKKETSLGESKMAKSDFKSLLDEQKKKLEPEPSQAPVMASKPKNDLGPSSPIDQAISPSAGGASGADPNGTGNAGGPGQGNTGMAGNAAGGGGGDGMGGDPFGAIGYGDGGGGGSGERFSFSRPVEYGGAGGGGGMGGEVATTVDGVLVDELSAATDGKAARGSARESGQLLRVGIEASPKNKRWVFDWTKNWVQQVCSGRDAKEIGVCLKLDTAKARHDIRKVTSSREASM